MLTETYEYFRNQILWKILVRTMTAFQNSGESDGALAHVLYDNCNSEGFGGSLLRVRGSGDCCAKQIKLINPDEYSVDLITSDIA